MDQRQKILKEFVDTEQAYVNSLNVLITQFLEPLKKSNTIEISKDLASLISTVSMIRNLNSVLLTKLRQAEPTGVVGKTLLTIIPFLKLYTQYYNSYEAAATFLRKEKQGNVKYKEYIVKLDDSKKKSGLLGFDSYLIQPIQRIPRYALLLEQLLKYTDQAHEDYFDLDNALNKTKSVADFINSQFKEYENVKKFARLQAMIAKNAGHEQLLSYLLQPHRRYVYEGELTIESMEPNEENSKAVIGTQQRYCYLLSDMLLCCTKMNEQEGLFVNWDLSLDSMPMPFVIDWKMDSYFELVSKDMCYTFKAPSQEEKLIWVGFINTLMGSRNKAVPFAQKKTTSFVPQVVTDNAAEIIQCIGRGYLARRKYAKERSTSVEDIPLLTPRQRSAKNDDYSVPAVSIEVSNAAPWLSDLGKLGGNESKFKAVLSQVKNIALRTATVNRNHRRSSLRRPSPVTTSPATNTNTTLGTPTQTMEQVSPTSPPQQDADFVQYF